MSEHQVLVIGENSFKFHRIEDYRNKLERLFNITQGNIVITTNRNLLLPDNINQFDAVIDYMTDSRLCGEQLSGLLNYVRDGGGYIGLHCAADLTLTTDGHLPVPLPELRNMIGGHFVSHPEKSHIDAKVVNSYHPVTKDIDDFSVWDEPYKLNYDQDVDVLIRMDHDKNPDMPVAWKKAYGDGSVFYCSLGHESSVYEKREVRKLLNNALDWVISRE